MKKILALLLAVIIVCAAFTACGTPSDETINGDYTDNGVTEVPNEDMEDNSSVDDDTKRFTKKQAVILMGQSNMAGRGHADIVEAIYDERITMLHDDQVLLMREPIHQDKNAAGVGLAASFAKAFVETFDQELLLIPCAYGGTSLSQWQKGSTNLFTNYYGSNKNYQLYQNAVDSAKNAIADGYEICAILWHQGESDSGKSDYAEKLKVILDDFMNDVGLDPNNVVIVTGEIGHWRTTRVMNDTLPSLENYYPKYGVATAQGLINNAKTHSNDDTAHFDAPSLRVLGYRYFEQFYEELTGKDCPYTYSNNPDYYRIKSAS